MKIFLGGFFGGGDPSFDVPMIFYHAVLLGIAAISLVTIYSWKKSK